MTIKLEDGDLESDKEMNNKKQHKKQGRINYGNITNHGGDEKYGMFDRWLVYGRSDKM